MDSDAMRQAYQRAVNDTPNYNDPWPPPTVDTTPEYVVVTDGSTFFIAVKQGAQYDIIGTAVNSYYASRIVKAMKGDN